MPLYPVLKTSSAQILLQYQHARRTFITGGALALALTFLRSHIYCLHNWRVCPPAASVVVAIKPVNVCQIAKSKHADQLSAPPNTLRGAQAHKLTSLLKALTHTFVKPNWKMYN